MIDCKKMARDADGGVSDRILQDKMKKKTVRYDFDRYLEKKGEATR